MESEHSQKPLSFRALFQLGVLLLMLLVPGLYFGASVAYQPALVAWFLLLLIYAFTIDWKSLGAIGAPQLIALLLAGWMVIDGAFFSAQVFSSLLVVLLFIAGTILYFVLSRVPRDERFHLYLAYGIVGVGALLSLVALFGYLPASFLSVRMSGTFHVHTVFSSFLILPLLLSLYLAVTKTKSYLWSAAAILLGASLALSLSRGSIAAAVLGVILLLAYLFVKAERKIFLRTLVTIIALLLAASVVAYGLYALKVFRLGRTQVNVSESFQYENAATGETGILSRLQYMRDAVVLFQERPVTGTGPGAFTQEALRIQTDARFFTTDPHSVYLRMFAETGMVGGLLFLVFIVYVLWDKMRRLFKKPRSELSLDAAYLAGALALFAHYAIDVEFALTAHIVLFFLLMAVLTKHVPADTGHSWKLPTVSVVSAGLLISLALLFGRYCYYQALSSMSGGDIKTAGVWLGRGALIDPINPYSLSLHVAQYAAAGDEENEVSTLVRARNLYPYDRQLLLQQAGYFVQHGKYDAAERAYREAILRTPYADLVPDVALATMLMQEGRTADATQVAQEGLARFPADLFTSALWPNLSRETILVQVASLKQLLALPAKKS